MSTRAEQAKDLAERSGPPKPKRNPALKHRPHRGARQDAERALKNPAGKPARRPMDRG